MRQWQIAAMIGAMGVLSGDPSRAEYPAIFANLTTQGLQASSSVAQSIAVAVGDLDNDGLVDVVSRGTGQTIYVNRRNAAGFDFATTYSGGTNVVGVPGFPQIALADFSGDGFLDVVYVEWETSTLGVRMGNGDGTLGGESVLSSLSFTRCVATGDLDGDGDIDIVAGNSTTGAVSVCFNQGGGAFAPTQYLTAVINQISIAIGDIDGDGDRDIACVNEAAGSLSVFPNVGGGAFGARQDYAFGATPKALALGDFNGDGLLDAAVSIPAIDRVYLLTNTGGTSFLAAPSSVVVGGEPGDLVAEDMDGDGHADLVVTNADSGYLSMLWGVGDGTFAPQSRVYVSPSNVCRSIAVRDVDGNGTPDLVCATSSGVVAITNQGSRAFGALRASLNSQISSQSLAMFGRINGDDHLDVVVADITTSINPLAQTVVRGLVGDGTGLFSSGGSSVLKGTRAATTGDFNGDGLTDLVVQGRSASGSVRQFAVFDDLASGSLVSPIISTTDRDLDGLAAGDLDGDGLDDLLGADNAGGRLITARNLGGSAFAASVEVAVGPTANSNFGSIRLGDIDGDGDIDVVIARRYLSPTGGVYVLTNDGTGALTLSNSYHDGYYQSGLAIGDVDGDGDLDLVYRNDQSGGPSQLSVLRNDGFGGFGSAETIDGPGTPSVLLGELIDLDGDGDLDYANGGSVWLNDGSGGFASRLIHVVGGVFGDVNDDSMPDLVLAASGGCFAALNLRVGPGAPCLADINGDLVVDASDFVIMASNFGAAVPAGTGGDCNGDGVVNAADFVILAAAFGSACP